MLDRSGEAIRRSRLCRSPKVGECRNSHTIVFRLAAGVRSPSQTNETATGCISSGNRGTRDAYFIEIRYRSQHFCIGCAVCLARFRWIRDAFVLSSRTSLFQILWFYYSDGLINVDVNQFLRSPAWPHDGQGTYDSCLI